jgi:hypothetical protein
LTRRDKAKLASSDDFVHRTRENFANPPYRKTTSRVYRAAIQNMNVICTFGQAQE